jgi:microcompartment protein CcmK/EutM
MRLGKVIGKLVLNRQDPAYHGGRWLIVSPLDHRQYAAPREDRLSGIYSVVVYDNLGAREGDTVGFVEGTEATAPFPHPIPIDAINAAIIDHFQYQPPS